MDDWALHFDPSPVGAGGAAIVAAAVAWSALAGAGVRRTVVGGLVVVTAVGAALAAGASAGRWEWPLLAAFAAVLVAVTLRNPLPDDALGVGGRRVLRACRMAAVLLLLIVIVRPVLTRRVVQFARPTLAVLLDQSGSMAVRDVVDPATGEAISRAAAATRTFAATRSRIAALAGLFDVQVHAVGLNLSPATDWTINPRDRGTALAAALDEIQARLPEESVVLLISDGAENAAPREAVIAAARRLGEGGRAVFCVGLGSEVPTGDARRLEIRDLQLAEAAPRGATLAAVAQIRTTGYAGAPIQAELLCDGQAVAHERFEPAAIRHDQRVSLSFRPDRSGFHKITLRLAARHGAADAAVAPAPASQPEVDSPAGAEAATRSGYVLVYEDQPAALLVEAHPRVESAFIARSLAGGGLVRVRRALLARPADGDWKNPLPETASAWRAYRAVVLGDVSDGEVSRNILEALEQAVREEGVGLVLLAGPRKLSLARRAPLDELVPCRLSDRPGERLVDGLVLTPAGRTHWRTTSAPARPATQEFGRTAPALGVDVDLLPGALSAVELGEPKPTAEVWAEDRQGAPLVAGIRVGRGRCVVVGVDGTWSWCMKSDEGAGRHAAFWRQLVTWTIQRVPAAVVRTDRPRYEWSSLGAGQAQVRVEARVVDPVGNEVIPGADVQVQVRRLATEGGAAASAEAGAAVRLSSDRGGWSGVCPVSGVGVYELTMTARLPPGTTAGEQVVTAAHRFVVTDEDPETHSPEADLELLRRAAAASADAGGRCFALAEWRDCLDALSELDRRRAVETTERTDLAARGRWPLFAAVAVLLCVEWAWRKRAGYV